MRKFHILSTVALFCALTGCSPRDFLTRRLASDLIAGSDVFKAPQQFWLRTGILSNSDYSSPDYLVLQRRGWIAAASAPCEPKGSRVVRTPGEPTCWDVTLTPLGVEAFRALISTSATPAKDFSVPIAKRDLVEITGISKAGNFADVEFRWKWLPMNEVGAALSSEAVVYTSDVAFRQYDDGWRVVQSSAKTNQSLQEALKNTEPAQ